jgi:hypothetical protein
MDSLPEDINLTRALKAESVARAHTLRSQTTRNILYGSAALVLAGGIGAASIVYANNQKLDIEALKRVIEQMPALKIATIPALTLEKPSPFKLEEGTVKIADGGTVSIDPSATVDVKGTITAQQPVQPQLSSQPQKTSDGDAIKTEVTVFNEVSFGQGTIVTGWRYSSGSSRAPATQYCYYNQIQPDGSEQTINVAFDRIPLPAARKFIPNLDAALTKCVWYGGV